jgi:hypothetical protein
VGTPATSPSAIAVGASFNDRIFAATMAIDGTDAAVAIPGNASASAAPVRAPMVDVTNLDPTGLLCSAISSGSLTGKVVLIRRGVCFFEEKLNFAQQAGAVAAVVATDADRPNPSTMSVGASRLPAMMIGYADGVRAAERLQAGAAEVYLDFVKKAVPVNSAELADFTSKGPSVDFRIKPDLLAVGTAVYTAQPTNGGTAGYGVLQGTSFSAPMVAGAAALLKAFRPGLAAAEYKSLLVNSASTFLSHDGATFPMQHTGAGLLDVSAAVQSTVAATPSSVDFGAGGSTSDLTRRVVIKNEGKSADTFAVTVAPLREGPIPSVTPDTLPLAAGQAAEVTVRWKASGLSSGTYEGFLVAQGTQSNVAARIPYWYAATSDAAASSVLVLEAPDSGRRSSTQQFYVRALDSTGIPVMTTPRVTTISEGAGARVAAVESSDTHYPGFYRVQVELSSEPGANVFEIESGTVKTRVTINGV